MQTHEHRVPIRIVSPSSYTYADTDGTTQPSTANPSTPEDRITQHIRVLEQQLVQQAKHHSQTMRQFAAFAVVAVAALYAHHTLIQDANGYASLGSSLSNLSISLLASFIELWASLSWSTSVIAVFTLWLTLVYLSMTFFPNFLFARQLRVFSLAFQVG